MDRIKKRFDLWYDYFPPEPKWKVDEEIKLLNIAIESINKSKLCILDLGCGSGIHSIELDNISKGIIHAIDFSSSAGKLIKERKRKNCTFLERDFFSYLSTTDFMYDLIFALDFTIPLYNIDELDKLFKKISEKLNRGGLFVFDSWNLDCEGLEEKLNYSYKIKIENETVLHTGEIKDRKAIFKTLCDTNSKFNLETQYQYLLTEDEFTSICNKYKLILKEIKTIERIQIGKYFVFIKK